MKKKITEENENSYMFEVLLSQKQFLAKYLIYLMHDHHQLLWMDSVVPACQSLHSVQVSQ